jgi:hypothetical protein
LIYWGGNNIGDAFSTGVGRRNAQRPWQPRSTEHADSGNHALSSQTIHNGKVSTPCMLQFCVLYIWSAFAANRHPWQIFGTPRRERVWRSETARSKLPGRRTLHRHFAEAWQGGKAPSSSSRGREAAVATRTLEKAGSRDCRVGLRPSDEKTRRFVAYSGPASPARTGVLSAARAPAQGVLAFRTAGGAALHSRRVGRRPVQ